MGAPVIHYYINDIAWIARRLKSLVIRLIIQQLVQANKKTRQSSISLARCKRNPLVTGKSPSQMGGNAESVSILWRHHIAYFGLPLSLGISEYQKKYHTPNLGVSNFLLEHSKSNLTCMLSGRLSPFIQPNGGVVYGNTRVFLGDRLIYLHQNHTMMDTRTVWLILLQVRYCF